MGTRLSKSKFQTGLQCELALWFDIHEPDTADPTSESQQWTFDQGTEVGRVAHGLFPGGVEVTEDHRHPTEALATTAALLSDGADILYEPAFAYDGAFARVDILVRCSDGSWDLYEVKSSSKVKPEHVTDAAIQMYVVEGSGLKVRAAHIVHIDTTYVYRGGGYDLPRLFKIEDVTAEARAFLPEVPGTLERFRAMLDGPRPEVRIGRQCENPYTCSFTGRCHAFLPESHPVTDLPRWSDETLHGLLDLGITCISDIPIGLKYFPVRLSGGQFQAVCVVRAGVPQVDAKGLAEELSFLEWPVYHLDFETVAPALPLWPGTRPYELIPFQYSIHVHHEDGTHEHREYLHVGGDPRRPLVERMLQDLGTTGSITHYTGYEVRCLTELRMALPELAEPILAVIGRLVDLDPIVNRNTKHPDAAGKTSIKYVLPAWCPDASYDDLGIRDGQTASVRYLKAVRGLVDADVAQQTYADLVEYCGMDTFAMVRLLEAMRALT
jgi:hypothetical protein